MGIFHHVIFFFITPIRTNPRKASESFAFQNILQNRPHLFHHDCNMSAIKYLFNRAGACEWSAQFSVTLILANICYTCSTRSLCNKCKGFKYLKADIEDNINNTRMACKLRSISTVHPLLKDSQTIMSS